MCDFDVISYIQSYIMHIFNILKKGYCNQNAIVSEVKYVDD